LLYPVATLFCIVVTGNHYWIDGLGGLAALGIGIVAGFGMHRWNTDRLDRRTVASRSSGSHPALPPEPLA
jgi:hypothetical protein